MASEREGSALCLEASEPADFLSPDARVRSFEYDGHIIETGVVHEAGEEVASQIAVAKGLVAVDM